MNAKKYGETVSGIKTKQEVLKHVEKTGQKLGAFYDIAAKEKLERERVTSAPTSR